MNNQFCLRTVRIISILILSALLLSGCLGNNSRPASYYLLTADKSLEMIAARSEKPPAILIRAVHIPDYLDRKQIVTRQSAHGLMVSDQHRWGGRFRKNIGRVLSTNLSYYLQGASVAVSPHSQPMNADYLLEISIQVFEQLENGLVMLTVDWYLIDAESLESVSFGKENISSETAIPENNYNAIVASMSRALDILAHKIAYVVSQQNR